jgi:hypothetical protein
VAAAACPDDGSSDGSDAGCSDGALGGEESDVDCGGRVCRRCDKGSACVAHSDCSSSVCEGGACEDPAYLAHEATFLQEYLGSEFYTQSFAHWFLDENMDMASYRNPYPIMDASFCDGVGHPKSDVDGTHVTTYYGLAPPHPPAASP